jgi:hypothetical protein
MTTQPKTVVLDNEAVVALADVAHPKHQAVLALIEVTNQRRARNERLSVVVPTAVRVEAGWDRTDPAAAQLNRISRAVDVDLDAAGANRCVGLRRLVPEASVVDATVALAAEAARLQPVTIITSDADDITRLVGYTDTRVVVAVI